MNLELDADGLPSGFFYSGDIAGYRNLAAKVPDGGTIVEIGVFKGRSLCSIAPACKARGIRMYAVDPWIGCEPFMQLFQNHIQHFGVADIVTILRAESHIAAQSFAPASVDMVFVDGPHDYQQVKRDIQAWVPKIKPGGYIAGHDYCPEWPGVGVAVVECFGERSFRMRVTEEARCDCWCHQVTQAPRAAGPHFISFSRPTP